MSVGSTGARKEDILTGSQKGTNDALLQVFNDITPSEKILNIMRPFPEIWSKFLLKLGGVPFFKNMSIKDRDKWLDNNETKDDFFDEYDKIKLLQPGVGDSVKKTGSIFSSYLSSNDIDIIMSVNKKTEDGHWSPTELQDIIVGYTGKTSTLVFLLTDILEDINVF
jgi:hypothetical protein